MNQWKVLLFAGMFVFLILKTIFSDTDADGKGRDVPAVENTQKAS